MRTAKSTSTNFAKIDGKSALKSIPEVVVPLPTLTADVMGVVATLVMRYNKSHYFSMKKKN